MRILALAVAIAACAALAAQPAAAHVHVVGGQWVCVDAGCVCVADMDFTILDLAGVHLHLDGPPGPPPGPCLP